MTMTRGATIVRTSTWSLIVSRPVVLLHILLQGLGRGRVEYLGSAQIFYSPSAQPRQKDMQENYRYAYRVNPDVGWLSLEQICSGLVR